MGITAGAEHDSLKSRRPVHNDENSLLQQLYSLLRGGVGFLIRTVTRSGFPQLFHIHVFPRRILIAHFPDWHLLDWVRGRFGELCQTGKVKVGDAVRARCTRKVPVAS